MTSNELKRLFKRYMKTQDSKTAHAILSASGSERWLGCPASISLSKGKPNVEHESAKTGTHAHTLLQFILENDDWVKLLCVRESKVFTKHIGFSPAQLKAVSVAAQFVLNRISPMKKTQMFVEQKLELEGVGFGTADVILYQPFGLLHIIDYKNGKYPVSPTDNTQGLYYAVAAADQFGWDFKEAQVTIIQPNAPGKAIKTWRTTPKRLEQAKLMFTRGAVATRKKNPAIVPNAKYCWFCPARPTCPAHVKQRQEKIMNRFMK